MAELKPMEVIMRIDFVAHDGEQICAHAEKVQELIRCKDCEWFRKEYGWNCVEYTELYFTVKDMPTIIEAEE